MEIKNKKRRPGKKQRIAKALGSKRVKEREEKDKELKKQRKRCFTNVVVKRIRRKLALQLYRLSQNLGLNSCINELTKITFLNEYVLFFNILSFAFIKFHTEVYVRTVQ